MKKSTLSVFAVWFLGILACGSLYAYEYPAYVYSIPFEGEDESSSLVNTPPPLPDAPKFNGLEASVPSGASWDEGSVLELWFRQEGISEKDIKVLSQLPADQKALIRKIVQAYQIDMQQSMLDIRPSCQKIQNEIDVLKLELSRLILTAEGSNYLKDEVPLGKEVQTALSGLAVKEAELAELKKVQDKITKVFREEMTDQIASVVNAWISAQASKSKESLSELFIDAEKSYGLNYLD